MYTSKSYDADKKGQKERKSQYGKISFLIAVDNFNVLYLFYPSQRKPLMAYKAYLAPYKMCLRC